MDSTSGEHPSSKQNREEEILELAKKELLRDIKCASIRAEQFGAHSWAKPQKYVPSKRFLNHLIVNDSRFNNRREQQRRERKRGTSSYVQTKSENLTKNYSLHSRSKGRRENSSEDEGGFRPNKSEKSSYDTEKRHSRWKSNNYFSNEDKESSLKYVEKDKLVEKDEHCSPLSKHHKSKKHSKKKKSKSQEG